MGEWVEMRASWDMPRRFEGEPRSPETEDEVKASQWDAARQARAHLDSITPNVDAKPQDPPYEVRETGEPQPPEGAGQE